MRLAGYNAYSKHVLNCALQPRLHIRAFKTVHALHQVAGSTFPDDSPARLPPPNPHAREIAILGGGLTGLATAFHLNRELPKAKITIYEQNKRLGGWVSSEVIDIGDGEVLFEWGPRTIRSSGGLGPMSMIELVGALTRLPVRLLRVPIVLGLRARPYE
jgi:hypothetical protein